MNEKVGPTGDFPKGKALPYDEGGLQIGFRIERGINGEPIIVMGFGKDVGWIGLEPEFIDGFCEILQKMKKRALEMAKED